MSQTGRLPVLCFVGVEPDPAAEADNPLWLLADQQGWAVLDRNLPSIYEDPGSVVTRLVRFAAAGMKAPHEEG